MSSMTALTAIMMRTMDNEDNGDNDDDDDDNLDDDNRCNLTEPGKCLSDIKIKLIYRNTVAKRTKRKAAHQRSKSNTKNTPNIITDKEDNKEIKNGDIIKRIIFNM